MRKIVFTLALCVLSVLIFAQKKPLDHSVYDGWQSIGEKIISNDGNWIVYTIDPQEGDNQLIIQSATDTAYKLTVERGYNAAITNDNRYLVLKIKSFYKDIREAKIKKKKPEESPKDSLAIIELGKDSIWKQPDVKSYKLAEKGSRYIAWQQEMKKGDKEKEGTALGVKELETGKQFEFNNIKDYVFDKKGEQLLMNQNKNSKDSLSYNAVLLFAIRKTYSDTISKGGSDFKNFQFSEDGTQLAFVAERDSSEKSLQKFYKLWYYKEGMDTATLLADKNNVGMKIGTSISEYGKTAFSKSGKRLFFGSSEIQPPKDTTFPEIDKVEVDIWNYKDDYLQPMQLKRLKESQQENYMTLYNFETASLKQVESKEMPTAYQTADGDGETLAGISDYGNRVEMQWTGNTKKNIYAINANTGAEKLIKKNLSGVMNQNYVSPSGKYIAWYDFNTKNYFAYDGDSTRNITAGIKTMLYDEDNDSPTDPAPYGIMSWQKNDSTVYIYDRYDIWKADPSGKISPQKITDGRKEKIVHRFIQTDKEEKSVKPDDRILVELFYENTKKSGLQLIDLKNNQTVYSYISNAPFSIGNPEKAKNIDRFIYTKANYTQSPDIYVQSNGEVNDERKLSSINPQQAGYNWGTAELYKWTAFDGKQSEGILYKPEDFDATIKYPLILYFYEKLSQTLYNYIPPAPTASRLNISFFVSRGYLVFVPDISYTIGHPAKSAYNYIVSAAKDLTKYKWVDAKNIGIQGQSWGGIQVAQLITMTDMFKAAWAGAPVANMTSAYGGIRWGSGMNRQFQYEKTQSRIGATLWEKPALYIENSPLFQLPNVKTPLVIMHNDGDGAVPWYQGIELYTGLRRLGKPVWMLNYNGEDHNLVQRKNRKDIQIREQQYFDWLLKGDKPARWLSEGVPAVKKGIDLGLDVE